MGVDRVRNTMVPPEILQAQGDKEVQETKGPGGVLDNQGVVSVLTIRGQKITWGPPDLDTPTTKPDPNLMGNTVDKFNQINDDSLRGWASFTAGVQNLALGGSQGGRNIQGSGNTNDGSYDFTVGDGLSFGEFIQLMKLMQQIFQQQRKAARETRHAEMKLQQQEIMKQAESLRKAATTALVMGFVTAAVTIAMMSSSIKGSMKATKLSTKAVDMKFSVKQIKAYQNAKVNVQKLNNQIKSIDAQIQQKQNALAKLESQKPATTQKTDAQTTTAPSTATKATQAKPAEQTAAKQQVKKPEKASTTEQQEDAKVDSKKVSEEKARLQKEIKELESKKQELVQMKQQYESDMAKIQKDNPDIEEQAQKTDKYELAKKKAELERTQLEAQEYRDASESMRLYAQAIGQALGGIREFFIQNYQADATEHEAQAKVHEQHIQDETEWMQNMRDLIRDAQEAVKAVQQSLIETQRSIFTQI